MYIVHDGPDDAHAALAQPFLKEHKNIRYFQTERRHNDWGHSPTAWAISELIGDESHVLLTNDDNYYVPVFVEYMLGASDRHPHAIMIACHCIHNEAVHHNNNRDAYGFFTTHFRPAYIDLGAYVTDARIAKEIGFNSRKFEADALFMHDIRERYPDSARYVVLNHALFVHN